MKITITIEIEEGDDGPDTGGEEADTHLHPVFVKPDVQKPDTIDVSQFGNIPTIRIVKIPTPDDDYTPISIGSIFRTGGSAGEDGGPTGEAVRGSCWEDAKTRAAKRWPRW